MNKGLRETPRSRTSNAESRESHDRIFGDFKSQGAGKKTYKIINGELTLVEQSKPVNSSAYVMNDISAYKSPLDGSIISSRSAHKLHKREHGVIEVGNEKLDRPCIKDYQPENIREDLKRTIEELRR